MDHSTSLETLLIGIDAACDRVLQPLFEDGELPTLASIFENGASGPLDSQIPPWTASAWPSLYTGMNPGKHGVFSFLSFDNYEWDVVNATDVRERTLWELLGQHETTSVIVNVPVTHPPRAFDGALIPGYTAPEDPECHPEGLLDEVRNAIGTYRVYPPENDVVGLTESCQSCVRMRGEAFQYLADRFDPTFGFVQFQATDSIFHARPDDDDAIRTIYREVDRQVDDLLEICDPDNVIVASDHGIGPYNGYEFRVNDYLFEEGYVEIESGGRGMPTWATVRDANLKEGESATRHEQGAIERIIAAAAKAGVTSQRVGTLLDRLGITEPVAKRVPSTLVKAGETRVSFPDSVAYMRARIELGVRINLEGRDPDGVVPPSEYEAVRTDLIEVLRSVTTPDGKPVFEAVLPREEHFHGPESDRSVDIVTVPADFDHFLSTKLRGEQFGPPTEPWNHKFEGTFAAIGADIMPDADLEGAQLFDVAPTVLSTLNIPYDERMDGAPLSCVEPIGTQNYPRFTGVESVATEDHRVEDRLSDLGYLE
ncbi:alkaline phosphatase family protein [Natronorubrum thiooxidans]|uniref:Predicted phosphohydrolase or phosphomutase, AlkP superfamily n=1 Tax=Natronorubrum thiooxidans TaxID=308853 RepID=A0A1N7FS35_9EURY|nr:alkaline phosphatase family protein [Natronorubrum thiooxidans]SIS03159.1 Predicted phosphohydrolase or phosphomutase, AlkP superfamily [Natronorubrum thiooxidans]